MNTLIKSTALGLTAAMLAFGAGSVATSTAAEAKQKKFVVVIGGGHGHFRHYRHSGLYLTSGFVGPGCGYSYARWQDTGLFIWKKRYYECRGWW